MSALSSGEGEGNARARRRRVPVVPWIFLSLLMLPALFTPAQWRRSEAEVAEWELRRAAAWPAPPSSWRRAGSAFAQIEKVLVDHCAFRRPLIGAFARFRWTFGASTTPAVVIGKKRWLFFDLGGTGIMQRARGLFPLSEAELASWVDGLEVRRTWLAGHGIEFVVVFPPSKEAFYPKMIPERFARVGPTLMDQIYEAIRTRTKVRAVDVRPALRELANKERVFMKSDTHWTSAGALTACLELQKTLRPLLPPTREMRREDYEQRPTVHAPDLAKKLGLYPMLLESNQGVFIKESACVSAQALPGAEPTLPDLDYRTSRPGGSRVYVAADSFFLSMATPYWSEAFSECRMRHHQRRGFDPAEVLAFHPQVVLLEIVEHALPRTLPAEWQ